MNRKKSKVIVGVLLSFIIILIVFLLYFFESYPLKYKSIIKKYSNEYDISPSLIASVINVESDFKKNSYSNAGAKGLMQLMDQTASEISNKLDENAYDLFEIETNIRYGTYYLRYLLNYYKNNELLALCAYNAGMSNVNNWLDGNSDLNENNIPFLETKNYIKKIKSSKLVYDKIYGFK